jgi:hypothetical protein
LKHLAKQLVSTLRRNPQKFVEHAFKAEQADHQVATQRICESSGYPSRISLPILKS